MENVIKLKEENEQLKKALSLCLNKSLIKRLVKAMDEINRGEYISEEEFFKNYQELMVNKK